MSTELLPCPFCASSNVKEVKTINNTWFIKCRYCGTTTGQHSMKTNAIMAWQRRPTTPPKEAGE